MNRPTLFTYYRDEDAENRYDNLNADIQEYETKMYIMYYQVQDEITRRSKKETTQSYKYLKYKAKYLKSRNLSLLI